MKDNILHDSHLYQGFRYAGSLSSIHSQREAQKQCIQSVCPSCILVVGCAYGEEMLHLLDDKFGTLPHISITAIDVAPISDDLENHHFKQKLGDRFVWYRANLLHMSCVPTYGQFDMVQCGFVLHDIKFSLKDVAIHQLANAVRPGGFILLSDIFITSTQSPLNEITEIYDDFLKESVVALEEKRLTEEEWNKFVGNDRRGGLLKSKKDAVQAKRDFYEPLKHLLERCRKMGLRICHVEINPHLPRLAIILAQRP